MKGEEIVSNRDDEHGEFETRTESRVEKEGKDASRRGEEENETKRTSCFDRRSGRR